MTLRTSVKPTERLGYGLGALGLELSSYVAMGYLVFYSTEVLGLDAAPVGAFVLIACLISAAVAAMSATSIDRVSSRFGTFRPFLVLSLPLALCANLLFWGPEPAGSADASAIAAYAWIAVLAVVFKGRGCLSFSCLSRRSAKEACIP